MNDQSRRKKSMATGNTEGVHLLLHLRVKITKPLIWTFVVGITCNVDVHPPVKLCFSFVINYM
jgi:hypothetical protein